MGQFRYLRRRGLRPHALTRPLPAGVQHPPGPLPRQGQTSESPGPAARRREPEPRARLGRRQHGRGQGDRFAGVHRLFGQNSDGSEIFRTGHSASCCQRRRRGFAAEQSIARFALPPERQSHSVMIAGHGRRARIVMAQVAAARMRANCGGRSGVREWLGASAAGPWQTCRGHPAARAQAFLRARISAVLFSRAICGHRPGRTCPTRASICGIPHRSSALPDVLPGTPDRPPWPATAGRTV
jgi:hypothetical protein